MHLSTQQMERISEGSAHLDLPLERDAYLTSVLNRLKHIVLPTDLQVEIAIRDTLDLWRHQQATSGKH